MGAKKSKTADAKLRAEIEKVAALNTRERILLALALGRAKERLRLRDPGAR